MDGDITLKEWPEIYRALIEKRCEIRLNYIKANSRNPDINDELLQRRIFHSVINLLDYFDE